MSNSDNSKINIFKKRVARRIVKFMMSRKGNSRFLLHFTFFIYSLLMRNYSYEPKFKNENHHYIPRFILKKFRINDTGLIYQYEWGNNAPKDISIAKEAACIQNYYVTRHIETGKNSLFKEKEIFSFVEDFAKIIIEDDILGLAEKNELNYIKGSTLAVYVAYQYTRTPAFIAQIKNFILFLLERRKVDPDLFSNKRKEDMVNALLNNSYKVTRKELVEFNAENKLNNSKTEFRLRYQLENSISVLAFISTIIGDNISESIYRKKLHILKAAEPLFFILPDSGVMIYDFEDEYDYFLWPYGWDLNKNSIAVFVLLSPEICLLYFNGNLDNEDIKDSFVKQAILLAYHQKQKYIFSNKKSNLIQENLNKFPLTNNFAIR